MATGCYTDLYLPASFKGVPFDAMEASSEHGRRGAEGEFPFGETTAYADLGRKIRRYTIRARYPENSHIADSAALVAAVESPGPGVLVHPTRGIVQAACTSLKVTDNILEEQGVTYLDLEFVEANLFPNGFATGGSVASLLIAPVISVAQGVFAAGYDVQSVQKFRRDTVLTTASAAVSAVATEYASAVRASAGSAEYQAIADFDYIADNPELLGDAATVSMALVDGMAATSRSLTGSDEFDAMRRIANSVSGATVPGKAGDMQDLVTMLTRVSAAAHMAQSILETTYSTSNDILDDAEVAIAALRVEESLAYTECDNELFIALRRFIVETQVAFYSRAFTLPGYVNYDFFGGVHPLVAAYTIFDDAKRHRELEGANRMMPDGRLSPNVVAVGA